MALIKVQGIAEIGGALVVTSGTSSATTVEKSFPGCTVTVYNAGTTNLSSIYSDSSSTPKSNPFTAGSDASWFFYVLTGNYDIKFSGTGITSPFTLSDVFVGAGLGGPPGTIDVTAAPYSAACDGSTDDTSALSSANAAAVAAGFSLYFPPSTSGCKTNTQTLSAPLIFNNGSLSVADGQVLTITGAISTYTPYMQIFRNATVFDGAGEVRMLGNNKVTELNVNWWGADHTGVADSWPAIQAAIFTANGYDGISDHTAGGQPENIHLPRGTYLLSNASLTARGVFNVGYGMYWYGSGHFYGDGQGQTIITLPSSIGPFSDDTAILRLRGTRQQVHDITWIGAPTWVGTGRGFTTIRVDGSGPARQARIYNNEAYGWNSPVTAGAEFIGIHADGIATPELSTTLGTTITAGLRTVTPGSMNGIYYGRYLTVGGTSETVIVTDISPTTFTATFVNNHASTDPVTSPDLGGLYTLVENNYFHDNPRASGIINGASYTHIINNRFFYSGDPTKGNHSIYDQAGYALITNNHFKGNNGPCVNLDPQAGDIDASGTQVLGNLFEDNTWDININSIGDHGFTSYLPAGNISFIDITNGGNYPLGVTPTISFGSPGSGAVAKAIMSNGAAGGGTVLAAIVTNGGSGYLDASRPAVTFSDSGGATAEAYVGWSNNNYIVISNNVIRRTVQRGDTTAIGHAGVSLGAPAIFTNNVLADLPNSNWLTSAAKSDKVTISHNRFVMTTSRNAPNTVAVVSLSAGDVFSYNIMDVVLSGGAASALNTGRNSVVTHNQIKALGGSFTFTLSPGIQFTNNTVYSTATESVINNNFGGKGVLIEDNTLVSLGNGLFITSDADLSASSGLIRNNFFTGKIRAMNWPRDLVWDCNTFTSGPFDDGLITKEAGQLGTFHATSLSIQTALAVTLSGSEIVKSGTSDTIFAGIVQGEVSSYTGNLAIVSAAGAVTTWKTDGNWTEGNVGVLSASDAAKVHDTGSQVPPAYPASYIIFQDSGSSGAGTATVKIMRTL